LRFQWRETGITLDPSLNKASGFGSKVLSVLAPAMVDGAAKTETSEDTLTWTVTIPSGHLGNTA
jgi:two-component sensor histidine kinase